MLKAKMKISETKENSVRNGCSSSDVRPDFSHNHSLLNAYFHENSFRDHKKNKPQNIFDYLWKIFRETVRESDKGKNFPRAFQDIQAMKSLRGLGGKNSRLARKIGHDFLMSKTQEERRILAKILLVKQILVDLTMRASDDRCMNLRDDDAPPASVSRTRPARDAQLHMRAASGEAGQLRSGIVTALHAVGLLLEQRRSPDIPGAVAALWHSVWEEADGGDADFQIFYVDSLDENLPEANKDLCDILKNGCDGMTGPDGCWSIGTEREWWLWRSIVSRYRTICSRHPALPRLLNALVWFDAAGARSAARTDAVSALPWTRALLLGGIHSDLIGIGMLASIPAARLQATRYADASFDSYVRNVAYAVACTDMECAWLAILGQSPDRDLTEQWAAELSVTADQPEHRMLAFLHLEVVQAKRFVYKAIYGRDFLDEDWSLSGMLLLAPWPGLQQEVVLKTDNLRVYRLLLPFLKNRS